MPNGSNNGNKENGNEDLPVVSKRPTREDLTQLAEAARDAAQAAAQAADVIIVAIEGETVGNSPLPEGEEMAGGHPGDDGVARPRTVTGPGAQATGHGMMMGGLQRHEGPAAYEQFMAALRDPLRAAGDSVRMSENAGWIKIEGMQGHKVYIAKTKTGVSRVESTLDPDLIKGASPPDRPNGMIASWIPANPEKVAQAIELLVKLKERPVPRPRGRGASERT